MQTLYLSSKYVALQTLSYSCIFYFYFKNAHPRVQCNIDFPDAASNDDNSTTKTTNTNSFCFLFTYSAIFLQNFIQLFSCVHGVFFTFVNIPFLIIYWHRWIFNGDMYVELMINAVNPKWIDIIILAVATAATCRF